MPACWAQACICAAIADAPEDSEVVVEGDAGDMADSSEVFTRDNFTVPFALRTGKRQVCSLVRGLSGDWHSVDDDAFVIDMAGRFKARIEPEQDPQAAVGFRLDVQRRHVAQFFLHIWSLATCCTGIAYGTQYLGKFA